MDLIEAISELLRYFWCKSFIPVACATLIRTITNDVPLAEQIQLKSRTLRMAHEEDR